MKRSGQIETVGKAVENIKKEIFENDAYRFWLFQKKWSEFAGENLAKESYIGRSEGNILFIYVQNSVWTQELFMKKTEILKKIRQDAYGRRFTELRLVAASETAAFPTKTNVEKEREIYRAENQDEKEPLTAQEEVWVKQFMEKRVPQKELRETLTQMMEKTLQRRKADLADGYTPCQRCGRLCPAEKPFCKSCEIKEKEKIKSRIFLQLMKEPSLYYEEIKKRIPCDYLQYETARELLIRRCKDQYFKGYDCDENQTMLLSLLIHKPTEAMTKEEIQAALSDLAQEKKNIERYENKKKREENRYGKGRRD